MKIDISQSITQLKFNKDQDVNLNFYLKLKYIKIE